MYSVITMHSFLFCLTASQSYQIQPLNSESIMQLDVRTAHLQCCREIALPLQSAAALTSGVGEFIPVCTLLLLLLISIHPFFSSSPCTAFFYHLLFSSIPYLPLLLLGSPHSTSSYYIGLRLLLFSLALPPPPPLFIQADFNARLSQLDLMPHDLWSGTLIISSHPTRK